MKIKHLLFFIPVTFLVACEGTDLIEPDNVSKEQISTQIIYNPTKYSKQKGDVGSPDKLGGKILNFPEKVIPLCHE